MASICLNKTRHFALPSNELLVVLGFYISMWAIATQAQTQIQNLLKWGLDCSSLHWQVEVPFIILYTPSHTSDIRAIWTSCGWNAGNCFVDFREKSWCWKITSDISSRRVVLTVVYMSIGSDVMRVKSGKTFVSFVFCHYVFTVGSNLSSPTSVVPHWFQPCRRPALPQLSFESCAVGIGSKCQFAPLSDQEHLWQY